LELRDRAKDIIVSGGESISTIEVEAAKTPIPACSRSPKTSADNIRKVELREAEWAGHANRMQG
jgi:hypothetical protein